MRRLRNKVSIIAFLFLCCKLDCCFGEEAVTPSTAQGVPNDFLAKQPTPTQSPNLIPGGAALRDGPASLSLRYNEEDTTTVREIAKAPWTAANDDYGVADADRLGVVGRKSRSSTRLMIAIQGQEPKEGPEVLGKPPLEIAASGNLGEKRYALGNAIGPDDEWHARLWRLDQFAEVDIDPQRLFFKLRSEGRYLLRFSRITKEGVVQRWAALVVQKDKGESSARIIVFDDKERILWTRKYLAAKSIFRHEPRSIMYWPKYDLLLLVGSYFEQGTNKPWVYAVDASTGESSYTFPIGLAPAQEASEVTRIQELEDGFLVTGWTIGNGKKDRNLILQRLSKAFDVVWTRICGGASEDEGWSLNLNGGAIYVGGETRSKYDDERRRAWILKFDQDGYLVWEQSMGDGRVISLFRSGEGMNALLGNGARYSVETKRGPRAALNWEGKHSWTRGMQGLQKFGSQLNVEPSLTCVDPSPLNVLNADEYLTKVSRDRRIR